MSSLVTDAPDSPSIHRAEATRLDLTPLDLTHLHAACRVLASAGPAVDVERCGPEQLTNLLAMVRRGQQLLDSLVVRIGLRADQLAELGRSAPASEFLAGAGRVRSRTARQEAARVQVAARTTAVGDAAMAGMLSADQLDSLARHAKCLTDDQIQMLDIGRLVADAARLPADTFDAVVKRSIEAIVDEGALRPIVEKQKASSFRHWFDDRTGMGRFTGELDPERYEALVTAVDQHTVRLASSATTPTARDANLAVAALFDLATSSGHRSPHLPHITVVVDERSLRFGPHDRSIQQTGSGHELPAESLARLCCDAVLQRVVLDPRGLPIDVGRKHRTATAAQWTAIRSVHSHCAWAGCDRPIEHCQLHHIHEWERGGPTDFGNLVPLCGEHHHRVHEGRWQIELNDDRALVITRPDGAHHRTTDPPSRLPADPEHPAT